MGECVTSARSWKGCVGYWICQYWFTFNSPEMSAVGRESKQHMANLPKFWYCWLAQQTTGCGFSVVLQCFENWESWQNTAVQLWTMSTRAISLATSHVAYSFFSLKMHKLQHQVTQQNQSYAEHSSSEIKFVKRYGICTRAWDQRQAAEGGLSGVSDGPHAQTPQISCLVQSFLAFLF